MGLSLGHTRQVLVYGFGLEVSRSGLCRALARMANKAAASYRGLVQAARRSLVNSVDETGWKVGGRLQWRSVRKRPCRRFGRGAATSNQGRFWGQTTRGFWCMTDGRLTTNLSWPFIKVA